MDGTPPLNIEWFKDGVSIKSNLDYRTTFDGCQCTLSIEETFTEDSALFTCRATNKAGVTESSAALSVKGKFLVILTQKYKIFLFEIFVK